MNRLVYNGLTGSLGRFMAGTALTSRLEDSAGLRKELDDIPTTAGDRITLLPLAALVPVPQCEKEPERARKINVTLTASLVKDFLNWTEQKKVEGRVLYVSTGHVYAPKTGEQLLNESDPVNPRSVYAKTKLEAEQELEKLFQGRPEDFRVARVFGLLAPQQSQTYILPGLIKRAFEKNFNDVPGLDGVRDYLDARDVCRHLTALSNMDWDKNHTVINVCSGEGIKIRQLFELVLDAAGITAPQITAAPPRADDIPYMVGDPSRLIKTIGGHARLTHLTQTIKDAVQGAKPA